MKSLGEVMTSEPGTAVTAAGPKLVEAEPNAVNDWLENTVRDICGPGNLQVDRSSLFEPTGHFCATTVQAVHWRLPAEAVPRVREMLERVTRPASEAQILNALYRLRMVTLGRGETTDQGRAAEARVWIELLIAYPADVVLHTIREWPRRADGKFWPTWHELERILRAKASLRTAMAAKLEALS